MLDITPDKVGTYNVELTLSDMYNSTRTYTFDIEIKES